MKLEFMNAFDANILIVSNEILQGREVKVASDVRTIINNASNSFLGVRSPSSKQSINPQERAKSTSEGLYLNDYIECLSLNVQGLKNLIASFENLTPSNLLLNSEEGKDDELAKMQRTVDISDKVGSDVYALQIRMKNIINKEIKQLILHF